MMRWKIYNTLIADDTIKDLVKNNIKFYEYPEAKDVKETHIIIYPLDVPKPDDFADDKWLTDDYLFQIDVWAKSMEEKDLVASLIRKLMWSINFKQLTGGIDEYDNEYDIFHEARRYRGKAYREDFNKL